MEKGIPILLFHRGNSYYLDYVINQAKYYNPNSEIIFIGDDKNMRVEKFGVQHHNMFDYMETANELEPLYIHMSSNSAINELNCLQRWLVLRDFVKKQKIEGMFFYMDSDVLLYANIADYAKKYLQNCDITVSVTNGPGNTYFADFSVLDGFANLIMSYYKDKEKRDWLIKKYENEYLALGKNSGITDMTMLELFTKEPGIKSLDTYDIRDNSVFDSHIAREDGYLMKGPMKRIKMIEDLPYCYNIEEKKWIRYLSIHFQGIYKRYMYRYYTADKTLVPSYFKQRILFVKMLLKHKTYKITNKIGIYKILKYTFDLIGNGK